MILPVSTTSLQTYTKPSKLTAEKRVLQRANQDIKLTLTTQAPLLQTEPSWNPYFLKECKFPHHVKASCKAAQSCPAMGQVSHRCTKQGSDKGSCGALWDFLNSSTHLDPEAFQNLPATDNTKSWPYVFSLEAETFLLLPCWMQEAFVASTF